MAKDKPPAALQIKAFADHHVITQPNPLRKVLRRVPESDLDAVPSNLIAHHINAIQAIVHGNTKLDTVSIANELSQQLRGIADEYLTYANRDRPEHLEAILAPSIVPGD